MPLSAGISWNGITGSKDMYILIFPVAKIMHICYTNFKQLWSSWAKKWKKLSPQPISSLSFVCLPFLCTSSLASGLQLSEPSLPDWFWVPPPPTHPSPHLLLPLSLSRDFLICPQGLGWDLGSQSNTAFTTKPTKSRSLANVFKSQNVQTKRLGASHPTLTFHLT